MALILPKPSPGLGTRLTALVSAHMKLTSLLDSERSWRGRLKLGNDGLRSSKNAKQAEFGKHIYISDFIGKMTGDPPQWNNSSRYWSPAAVICFLALVLNYPIYLFLEKKFNHQGPFYYSLPWNPHIGNLPIKLYLLSNNYSVSQQTFIEYFHTYNSSLRWVWLLFRFCSCGNWDTESLTSCTRLYS